MYLVELSTHAWDLARATGQIEELDPSLALPTLEGARAMIKPHFRNMVEPGAPFGAEVYPARGADDWERLACLYGTRSTENARSLSGQRGAEPSIVMAS